MSQPRILIAGIGNIFLGDDAFGVEVAQCLVRRPLPDEVRVVDFGIRGLDLAYAFLDGYEMVIFVDATPRGEPPGTLYVLELDATAASPPAGEGTLIETHNVDPVLVLRLAATLGGQVRRVFLVGCEPAAPGGEDDCLMELSAPVRGALDEAVRLTESLVEQLLRGDDSTVARDALKLRSV